MQHGKPHAAGVRGSQSDAREGQAGLPGVSDRTSVRIRAKNTHGQWNLAKKLENWPRGMGQFWHLPFVSNMTGGQRRSTKTGRR